MVHPCHPTILSLTRCGLVWKVVISRTSFKKSDVWMRLSQYLFIRFHFLDSTVDTFPPLGLELMVGQTVKEIWPSTNPLKERTAGQSYNRFSWSNRRILSSVDLTDSCFQTHTSSLWQLSSPRLFPSFLAPLSLKENCFVGAPRQRKDGLNLQFSRLANSHFLLYLLARPFSILPSRH